MTIDDPPIFTRDAIREVDRVAVEDYGIPGIVLMENAARGVAEHAAEMVAHVIDRPPRIGIVCGSGNNGGDGFAAARHLHNCGMDVTIVAIGEPKPENDAGVNAATCRKMEIPIVNLKYTAGSSERDISDQLIKSLDRSDLLIDAIFGTGLTRPVAQPHRSTIGWMNESGVRILAVDCPSGLDCESGELLGACITASRTVTFVGWKTGFFTDAARSTLGEIDIVDIGAPRELIERLRMK